MSSLVQILRQFFKNPYVSAMVCFLTSLAWFIAFAFFERRVAYLVIGTVTILFALAFLDQARRTK
ncbi:hypothetical protein [Ktedonobacter racemifer]|uniref:Uncharacterized protein n=1 Tax=Ktedonobacter racemifer DSM 44963 TaxID=485913 RepID=D6TPA0_KTERA|nr:hypothetical protein [Ktedonobacter racemifer]EFH87456.1 hypothetical protein Krac_8788 [Ktedonobacter racemifer DSM 44963]